MSQNPRDLHLRDADSLGDLGLRHVLDKPKLEHLALIQRELPRHGRDREPVFDQLVTLVALPERGGQSR
jgi:hypothetical protein